MASQEQPAILFLVYSSSEAEIYVQCNVYLRLKGNAKLVGQDQKSVVGKRKHHPISFKEPEKQKDVELDPDITTNMSK